jgi:hypothetical protein
MDHTPYVQKPVRGSAFFALCVIERLRAKKFSRNCLTIILNACKFFASDTDFEQFMNTG